MHNHNNTISDVHMSYRSNPISTTYQLYAEFINILYKLSCMKQLCYISEVLLSKFITYSKQASLSVQRILDLLSSCLH